MDQTVGIGTDEPNEIALPLVESVVLAVIALLEGAREPIEHTVEKSTTLL